MKLNASKASISAALLIGGAQTCLMVLCWAYIAMYTPLPPWLIGRGVTGTAFLAISFAADFTVSVLLSFPAAFLLCRLGPRNLSLYLLLAVVPGFLWQYQTVLAGSASLQDWLRYLPGALSTLLTLPVAALILQKSGISGGSDHAVKSRPLQHPA